MAEKGYEKGCQLRMKHGIRLRCDEDPDALSSQERDVYPRYS